jgi:excisionase family DNA binding protein
VKEAIREELESTLLDQRQKPEKLLLDTESAAAFLSVPATWLATMAREGKIKSLKLGHYVRFARTDLEAFILRMKDQGERS